MNPSPEIKQKLEEQKKECLFCKLISGEIPNAKKVFEDDKTVALLDIYPAIKGHTLFLLKEHYPIIPYIPAEEFKHYFGLLPQLSQAIKSSMVSTGINIFIANGGIAGQKFSHFLLHLLPREKGDGFFNFIFEKRKTILSRDKVKILAHNLTIMMQDYFDRNPAYLHQGKGEVPAFLKDIFENNTVIYENEKVACIFPENGIAVGHLEIYSKTEEKEVENLSMEDLAHLFFTASFAARAVFELLGAQGTNIILKSGISDDNQEGKLCINVIPRMQDDGLQKMLWQPRQPSYDLDSVMKRIKDNTWRIKYVEKKEEAIKIDDQRKLLSSAEEIKKAVEKIY